MTRIRDFAAARAGPIMDAMADLDAKPTLSDTGTMTINRSIAHDGAARHASGEALYVDDLPAPAHTLYAAIGRSHVTHMGIERVIEDIARHLGLDSLEVRKLNLYGSEADRLDASRCLTPYHMCVTDNILPELIAELEASADYDARRRVVTQFNADNRYLKRGLALTPVKFGNSFAVTHLNQAGALLHVFTDGSAQLNHGGTEMGQGLMVKFQQIVAEELQIDLDRVRITATTTGKVPNTSPTAASAGTDLNGAAALAAARKIKGRLIDFAADHFDVATESIVLRDNQVIIGNRTLGFCELAKLAYLHRVQLAATAFYKTPKVWYDRERAGGRPFYYFAYGVAASGVLIDTLTGEYRLLRRHPPRRRPLAQSGDRQGSGRGRLRPGHGLAHRRRALLARQGRAHHPRALHLQDPDGRRRASGLRRAPL